MSRPLVAEIDAAALRRNLERAREAAPGRPLVAVVKADGYGHGLIRVARALASAEAFGVACIEEALQLREAGYQHPILLLEGFFDGTELELVATQRLIAVIHHEWQLKALERASLSTSVRVWLKVDTGMHRLGLPPHEVDAARRRLAACGNVRGEVVLMTHLANADDREDPTTGRQLASFAAAAGDDAECSIANSAGILGWPESRRGWLRPGIMLYGASPFRSGVGAEWQLRPVMTLRSRLIAVNRYPRGTPIGYGGDWRCPEEMPVGVVAVGYGDGYPRHAPGGTPVLVNGKRVPLIGRVSMDMITVDLRTQPDAAVGDPVVLWGQGLPVECVAERAGTIAYELLCGVARGRVRYETVQEREDGQVL